MIETKNMEEFVQDQIRSAVEHFVASVVTDDAWMRDLEQRIVTHVQDRISARFSNIATVPDLVQTVQNSVQQLVTQGHVPGIAQYIDQDSITRAIDHAVQQEIGRSLDALSLDPVWIAKIETLINQNYLRRVSEWISMTDLDSMVRSFIDASVDRWQDRFKQDFATCGFKDKAEALELSLTPGQVSVTSLLTCKDLLAQDRAVIEGVLEVKDLVLKGTINTDNHSWDELSGKIAQDTLALITDQWRQDLVDGVLEIAKTRGIEFKDVTLKGLPLIQDGTLNPAVRRSQLESLGTLDRLSVAGEVDLSGTVHVRTRRLGINTQDPEMALSVWDEEIALVAGKLKQNHAYLGTARSHNFSLGVARKPYLEIDTDGLTTVKNFRIDRHRISFATQVPGYSGTRGDLVFNSDPNDGQPFAWVCLGAFRWQPLRAMQ
jgi:hypothetical protein